MSSPDDPSAPVPEAEATTTPGPSIPVPSMDTAPTSPGMNKDITADAATIANNTIPHPVPRPISPIEDFDHSFKLFVGGLSWNTTDERLMSFFAQYGPISEAVIMRDRLTGKSRGFGFVTFHDREVARHVLNTPLELDGRTIDPKPAVPRRETQRAKVFVGGLPQQATRHDLRAYFSKYGSVREALVKMDHKTGRSRGFGFVTFATPEAVDRILERPEHAIRGKHIECKRATPKTRGGDDDDEDEDDPFGFEQHHMDGQGMDDVDATIARQNDYNSDGKEEYVHPKHISDMLSTLPIMGMGGLNVAQSPFSSSATTTTPGAAGIGTALAGAGVGINNPSANAAEAPAAAATPAPSNAPIPYELAHRNRLQAFQRGALQLLSEPVDYWGKAAVLQWMVNIEGMAQYMPLCKKCGLEGKDLLSLTSHSLSGGEKAQGKTGVFDFVIEDVQHQERLLEAISTLVQSQSVQAKPNYVLRPASVGTSRSNPLANASNVHPRTSHAESEEEQESRRRWYASDSQTQPL